MVPTKDEVTGTTGSNTNNTPRRLRRRKVSYSSDDDDTSVASFRTPAVAGSGGGGRTENNNNNESTKRRKDSNRKGSASKTRIKDTSSNQFNQSIDIRYYDIRIKLFCAILVAIGFSFFDMNTTTWSLWNESSQDDKNKIPEKNIHKMLHDGDTNVLVVLMSDRIEGIIPTLASILKVTTVPVDVVLISGDKETNNRVENHFGSRINDFVSLTVDDATEDLIANGYDPIWKWPDWQSSINNSNWINENTIRTGTWDNIMTHAHELNHIRFYLPYMTLFRNKKYFYVVDDDILVFKDLAHVHEHALQQLESTKSLICPCNGWTWSAECLRFEFQNQQENILSRPALYGNRPVCTSPTDTECVPSSYHDFVHENLPSKIPQKAWNFGFTLFSVQNWKHNEITKRYENVMKESYRLHVFPETSLSFGLGIPYIALAGSVQCWNETDKEHVKVRDGFSFIDHHRFEESFGDNYIGRKTVDVVHYTGTHKPWMPYPSVSSHNIQPWLDIMVQENLTIPPQLSEQPTRNLFVLVGSSRSGNHWIMSTLDRHPDVCATGASNPGSSGYPTDVITPNTQLDWLPMCSNQRGCSLSFVQQSVTQLTSDRSQFIHGVPHQCDLWYDPIANNEPYPNHLKRICQFIKVLRGNYTRDAITKTWVEAFVNENKKLLGCQCSRTAKARGILVLSEWLHYKNYPHQYDGPALLNLNGTLLDGVKVIHVIRDNPWIRYRSMEFAKATGMFHFNDIQSKRLHMNRLQKTNITIQLNELEWFLQYSINAAKASNEWINDHASATLTIDYNDCRSNTKQCFERMYNFLNVSSISATGISDDETTMYDSSFYHEYPNDDEQSNAFVTNYEQVQEILSKYNLL